MKLRYTVTAQAYFDFSMYHADSSGALDRIVRKSRLYPPLVWLVMVAGFCAFFQYRFGRIPIAFPATFLAVSVLWYALYPRMFRKTHEKRTRQYIADGNGKEFLGDTSLELLDDRIRAEDQDGSRETAYAAVTRLVENKGCLYIFIGTMTAYIIPLDSFPNPEAYAEFRNLLEEKTRAASTRAQGHAS